MKCAMRMQGQWRTMAKKDDAMMKRKACKDMMAKKGERHEGATHGAQEVARRFEE